ncbi:unnamed protein product [Plutella xylostella]|uniref:(diamondback moth) hypothetical protein n=1 Tax=Plutella xylostella TaxID=51655 RepID=A0A8S4FQF7_PLUXY|nr:unnamed protein product [Plutella xylostella]
MTLTLVVAFREVASSTTYGLSRYNLLFQDRLILCRISLAPAHSPLRINPALLFLLQDHLILPNIPSTVATGNQPCSSIPVTKGAQKRKPLYPEPAKTNRLEIRRLQSEICRLRKKGASFKQRLETAQKFSEDVSFQRVIKNCKDLLNYSSACSCSQRRNRKTFQSGPIREFLREHQELWGNGARNVAPNSVAFEGAYKALMLNNYSTPHSRGANCEEDVNECLQTLEFFIKEKIEAPESPDVSEEQ